MAAVSSDPPPRALALEFLRRRSADTAAHLNGSLLDHLLGTEELLRAWGCPEELCRAGLCPAAYGTDGFAPFLVPWQDRRALVEVVGPGVEEIVSLYASCDRHAVYPQLPGHGPVQFRDRLQGRAFEASDDQLRVLADLTLANELEIAVLDGADAPAPSPAHRRALARRGSDRWWSRWPIGQSGGEPRGAGAARSGPVSSAQTGTRRARPGSWEGSFCVAGMG